MTGWPKTLVFLRPNSHDEPAKQDVMHCKACSVWVWRTVPSPKRRFLISLSWVWAWKRLKFKRLPSRRYLTHTQSSSSRSLVLAEESVQDTTYFTPVVMGKGPNRSLLRLIWFLCNRITICRQLGGQPSRISISHSPVLLTEITACVRLKKVAYSPLFCSWHFSWSGQRMNTMFVVPRKPHWLSGMVGTSLLSSTFANILPAMERRMIPQLLEQSYFSS